MQKQHQTRQGGAPKRYLIDGNCQSNLGRFER